MNDATPKQLIKFNQFIAATLLLTAASTASYGLGFGSPDPVTVNNERISFVGTDGDAAKQANAPHVAYNSINNEFFTVWSSNEHETLDGKFEIFGRRINATTGLNIATTIKISSMGGIDDITLDGLMPKITYNTTDNEYLVVWTGDTDEGTLVSSADEIFAQRINAETGVLIGDRIRISDMGMIDSDTNYDATTPAVTYNSTLNQYYIVWSGDDNSGALVNNEFEIYGQRLSALGELIEGDLRLSDMGPDGDSNFNARSPDVVYNHLNQEYFVVWNGDDDTAGLVNNESEIYGQRIASATGAEVGPEFRISTMGPDGSASYNAFNASVAYSAPNQEYYVVWSADDNTGSLVSSEFEIYGMRIEASSGALNTQNRLSDMGPDGNNAFDARKPVVNYNINTDQYFVSWNGDDDTGSLVNNESEVYTQIVDAKTGIQVNLDKRISTMGTDGDSFYNASNTAVAFNPQTAETFIVWRSDNDTGNLVNEEFEIYAKSYIGQSPLIRFNASNINVNENANTVDIDVTRLGNNTVNMNVDYSVTDGSATSPSDFTSATGTLSFAIGDNSETITVDLVDNNDVDGAKTFRITLSNATNNGIVDSQREELIVTINDDETVAVVAPSSSSGGGSISFFLLILLTILMLVQFALRKAKK